VEFADTIYNLLVLLFQVKKFSVNRAHPVPRRCGGQDRAFRSNLYLHRFALQKKYFRCNPLRGRLRKAHTPGAVCGIELLRAGAPLSFTRSFDPEGREK
jgi:hypothetical protein